MKKFICLFFLLLATTLVLPSQAYASNGFFSPQSKFHFIQNWTESIRLFFTFAPEKKLDYLMELTDRRVQDLQENPNLEQAKMEKITERYQKHFTKMEKTADNLKKEKQAEAVEKIKNASISQQETLVGVYGKVPEAAREGILNAEQHSAEKTAAIIEKVEGQEAAQEFQKELEQIRQVQMQMPVQKMQPVPMESGAPAPEPGQTQGKELLPAQPIQPGQELHEIGPGMETESGSGKQPMQPVSPAPMQPMN